MIRICSHRILAVSCPDQGLISWNPPSKSPNTRFGKRVLDVWEEDRIGEEHAPGNGKKDEAKTSLLHNGALGRPSFLCVQRPEAKDPGCMCCWHSSSVPYLSKGACGPAEAWRLGWGMSSFSPLPLLLPKQLTPSSDVVLWLDSKQHCSCGHGVLSVSESESCWLSSWE